MSEKMNCWDFKKCGRESGGANVEAMGICPVTKEYRLNGVHGGSNAGRSCWVVAGSLCKGETQGTFASKFGSCEKCDFYKQVRTEEFPYYKYSISLLNKIQAV